VTATLTGSNLIAGRESAQGSATFRSLDPRSGDPGTVDVHGATPDEIAAAADGAAAAFRELSALPATRRAELLRAIADEMEADGDQIVAAADRETGLGAEPRLTSELARTTGQLRAFARLLDDGWYVEAIIDTADDTHQDVRRMLVPIGPVAVFGPANFPLAFSVAGGDTASALAAGCPVVVKSHSSHPETSEVTARAVVAATSRTGAPAGTFSLIHGSGRSVGTALVRHPAIKAVGFTGSLAAGRALCDLAAARPEPIPVYAEMGSLNPVFVTAGALQARGPEIADGFVGSMTLGNGQFCTKPGLVFVDGSFADLVATRLATVPAAPMLNPNIRDAFVESTGRAGRLAGVTEVVRPSPAGDAAVGCAPGLLATDVDTFLSTPELSEEHFGPLSVVITCPAGRMAEVAAGLAGSLTATVHAEAAEYDGLADLLATLAARAGRIVFDGFPTGVAVVPSMHHGGPYPASSSSLHTSVGMTAIRRFLRPVAYQNAPQALLPPELRDSNPSGIRRLVDWSFTDPATEGSG
jgi:acyl-CoA reductase-like NAD-dependent aldehyde dehydrogenase